MTDFSNKYAKGIYYGIGMMYFDFSELSFLLGSMTEVYGGMGSTKSYMFYDKEKDTILLPIMDRWILQKIVYKCI